MPGSSAVSPREIIAIFGQSIGPGTVFPAQASTAFPATFPLLVTPTVAAGISSVMYEVLFKFGANSASLTAPVIAAPIIMVSSNQINAVVPVPPSSPSVYTLAAPNAWVQVVETTGTGPSATVVTTTWFPVTFVPEADRQVHPERALPGGTFKRIGRGGPHDEGSQERPRRQAH